MGVKLTILGKEYDMPIENPPGTSQPAKRRTWDHVAFNAAGLVKEELAPRGSPGLVAKRDLKRYYKLLRNEAPTITPRLALALVGALLMAQGDPDDADAAWGLILFALYPGRERDWIASLGDLPLAQRYALIDAAERASRIPLNEREERLGEFFTLIED